MSTLQHPTGTRTPYREHQYLLRVSSRETGDYSSAVSRVPEAECTLNYTNFLQSVTAAAACLQQVGVPPSFVMCSVQTFLTVYQLQCTRRPPPEGDLGQPRPLPSSI